MNCLGKMIWESQRGGRPPDGDACIAWGAAARHATPDLIWAELSRIGQHEIMSGIFTHQTVSANDTYATY